MKHTDIVWGNWLMWGCAVDCTVARLGCSAGRVLCDCKRNAPTWCTDMVTAPRHTATESARITSFKAYRS
jgi:hypothetical protein